MKIRFKDKAFYVSNHYDDVMEGPFTFYEVMAKFEELSDHDAITIYAEGPGGLTEFIEIEDGEFFYVNK